MNEQRRTSEARRRGAPADNLVGVLYGLPTLEVGTVSRTQPVSTIATVGEALDVESKIKSDLVAPVYEPDSLRRDVLLADYRDTTKAPAIRDGIVLPGRPFPKFPVGHWGR